MKKINITIDGKNFDSLEDVPPELGEKLGDFLTDALGDPESGTPPRPGGESHSYGSFTSWGSAGNTQSINIDGVSYDSLDAIPPEIRRKHGKMLDSLQADSSPEHAMKRAQRIMAAGPGVHTTTVSSSQTWSNAKDAIRDEIRDSLKRDKPPQAPVDSKALIGGIAAVAAVLLAAIAAVLCLR